MTYSCELEKIDSEVFGFDVYNLRSGNSDLNLSEHIEKIASVGRTAYVVLHVDAAKISEIHEAEEQGFRFLETNFATTLQLRSSYETSDYPYEYHKVETLNDLDEVCEIADKTTNLDRFSLDALIGKRLSGTRYVRYLQRSFHDPSEEVWAVRSRKSGRLLTFRSHRWLTTDQVRLLNGGVHQDFKESGLGVVSTHFCLNSLRSFGVKKAESQISVTNLPIVNLEVGYFDFKVTHASVVLRKAINWKL